MNTMLALDAQGYTDKMTHKAALYALTTPGYLPVTLRERDALRLLQQARTLSNGYVRTAGYRVDAYEHVTNPNFHLSTFQLRFRKS